MKIKLNSLGYSHFYRQAWIALGFAFGINPSWAGDCPSDLTQLHSIATHLQAAPEHGSDPAQPEVPRLWNEVETLKALLHYGSRSDQGDLRVFSYFFLEASEEEEALNSITRIIEISATQNRWAPLHAAAEDLQRKLVDRNLLHSLDWTPHQLNCLSGNAFERLIAQTGRFGLRSVELGDQLEAAGAMPGVPRDLEPQVKRAVRMEESIWPDTILEGDYAQEGSARARQIELILRGEQFIAVRFEISAPGVYTGNGDCRYDETADAWRGNDCNRGTLSVTRVLDSQLELVGSDRFVEFSD